MANFGDFPLLGKIAVVTGAGSGINLAFTRLAVNSGARVIMADIHLTSEAEQFLKSTKNAIFQRCDVTKWGDLEHLVTVSKNEFEDVPDVYVAGAGVFEPSWSNFWDNTEEERYAEVDINVNHPIKLTRIAIQALLSKNKKGVVLITASIAGYRGVYSAPLYCATKHAIVGFVRSMAEADPLEGVKVVTIAPGNVRTPLWTARQKEQFQFTDENSILPEDVAKSMMSLIQDRKYRGGASLEISPGSTRSLGTWNISEPNIAGTGDTRGFGDINYSPITELLRRERNVEAGSSG